MSEMNVQGNATQVSGLALDAGKLCLDFVNTIEWHASEQPVEYLNQYADLVAWARLAGIVDEAGGGALLRAAEEQPRAAERVLARAVAVREALFRIFTADEAKIAADDLSLFNGELRSALAQQVIARAGEDDSVRFQWQWVERKEALDRVLWPVVRSAADLLTSDELARVKMCEDDRGCGYMFFDTSRNRSRRWCSMESCGNRAKVQRYRRREGEK